MPILGTIIGGGQNEGIFGMTYEVVGPPATRRLRVNPMSMVAPGFLRKIFEFRSAESDRKAVPPIPRRRGSFFITSLERGRRS